MMHNREKLQKVVNADPMALIEYWSVDPDYDGEVFRSVWQDYRGNTENDEDPYRVSRKARLTGLAKDGRQAAGMRPCRRCVSVLKPKQRSRWLMTGINDLSLARDLSAKVEEACVGLGELAKRRSSIRFRR